MNLQPKRIGAACLLSLALGVACEPPGSEMLANDQSAGARVDPAQPYSTDPFARASRRRESPYAIVVLPDTQYYAARYPAVFKAQTTWIVQQRGARAIAFVVHEGDLVDTEDVAQWSVASDSMDILADARVPYVLSMGNHDYAVGPSGWPTGRSTMIDQFFPVARFSGNSWFYGTLDPAHIENSYAVLEVPDTEAHWLVVSLEFGPRDAVVKWADEVLKRHSRLPAIVVTHAYLYDDGTRYDVVRRPDQKWNPHRYPIVTQPGGVNDGEEIWQKLILPNPNVEFVLCGHVLGKGVARSTSTRPDGTIVHEILANYQTLPIGGGGYLRILTFFPDSRVVHVETYSPYLAVSKTDGANDFYLPY
ncbi:MAG TPA: metallophosphoesterase [Acidothermaceae bacterium]